MLPGNPLTTLQTPTATDAWVDWLVYADWLSERGDIRGELLVHEHSRLVEHALPELKPIIQWCDEFDELLTDEDAFELGSYLNLAKALPSFGNVPESFRTLFEFPLSWLIATISTDTASSNTSRNRIVQEQYAAVCLGLIHWIDVVFDGVPVPTFRLYQAEAQDNYERDDGSRDHDGRWQDLPRQHLFDCEYSFPHLRPGGLEYYLPAVMTLQLQTDEYQPESLSFSTSWDRFTTLTRDQRAAICAFTFLSDNEASEAWFRVILAERDGAKEQWWLL